MNSSKSPVVALVFLCALLLPAGRAHAQAVESAPSRLQWLADYHFHLNADSIRVDDPRFNWEARFGGDVDLLDYGVGRVNMIADYQVVVGTEARAVDPNQGIYHLAGSVSWRWRSSEFRAVYDHVSRHLSDRANPIAIAWNEAGIAVSARHVRRSLTTTLNLYGAKLVQAAFVDYTWQFDAGVEAVYARSRTVSLIGRANVAPTLVDPAIAARDTQTAGRIEGAVRLGGTAGAVELFVAWERRLDPYPLERATRSWALAGFRLLNR